MSDNPAPESATQQDTSFDRDAFFATLRSNNKLSDSMIELLQFVPTDQLVDKTLAVLGAVEKNTQPESRKDIIKSVAEKFGYRFSETDHMILETAPKADVEALASQIAQYHADQDKTYRIDPTNPKAAEQLLNRYVEGMGQKFPTENQKNV